MRRGAFSNWWTEGRLMGVKSMRTLPHAMWWMEQHGETCQPPHRSMLWSKSRTHRVEMGVPSLERMLWYFEQYPSLQRQCLIPHFKVRELNELLAFERGPQWKMRQRRDPRI